MAESKSFLTYNQQMKKLRNEKKIKCFGSPHKSILVREGYFNLINGYKNPFVSGKDDLGNHIYISDTSIEQFQAVKEFDDNLRSLLLRVITQIEEEVRTLASYKFDECNEHGRIPWYDVSAYSPKIKLSKKMTVISRIYNEVLKSHLDYVRFYMTAHEQVPTWIMFKVINFSTFIDVLSFGKQDVTHALCELYNMYDSDGYPNVKLLIGSLHWMRRIRNACAHNERVYCITRGKTQTDNSGRILDMYFRQLGKVYARDLNQRIMDLLVYCKYYLQNKDYKKLVLEIKTMLTELSQKIHPHAYEYVRGQLGIKKIEDLDCLIELMKDDIDYNKFDML